MYHEHPGYRNNQSARDEAKRAATVSDLSGGEKGAWLRLASEAKEILYLMEYSIKSHI